MDAAVLSAFGAVHAAREAILRLARAKRPEEETALTGRPEREAASSELARPRKPGATLSTRENGNRPAVKEGPGKKPCLGLTQLAAHLEKHRGRNHGAGVRRQKPRSTHAVTVRWTAWSGASERSASYSLLAHLPELGNLSRGAIDRPKVPGSRP